MPNFPTARLWSRVDTAGSDLALIDDRTGLRARGVTVASSPVPHTCRYELATDESWRTVRLEVSAEGAGWLRTVRMERATGRWRVTTAEQGSLGAALSNAGHPGVGLPGVEDPDRLADAVDVDLDASVLFNTLPVRRLRLAQADPDTTHELAIAWVRVPSLEVIPVTQSYTALGEGRVRFALDRFTAVLELDQDGFVLDYPGIAHRA